MKAKEFDIKKRDPNWRTMQDIRRSGAGGQHKDKKKSAKQGDVKHKGKDIEEGIGGMIAGGVGQFIGNKIDPLAGEIMRAHGEIAGRKAEYTIRKYMHLLQKALKQQLDSGKKEEGVEEDVDIGREWMSDTELDQYVPDELEQEWRELVGYDEEGNVHPLWANMTGDYEPDVSDPQHRAWMVKVANKWFAMKKIPNVKFYDVKDADDELEWSVQIGDQDVKEGSDWGEPREILEDVLQTLEREVEWPLTEVMDPREVKQLVSPIVRAVNDKMMSMEEGRRDYGYDDFGNSLRPGDDEGSTEPPNNFAIYINDKKWKVFKGQGHYADDQYEMAQFRRLQQMASKKSQETGKKWEVVRTSEPATK
jgi:hypothetical protein